MKSEAGELTSEAGSGCTEPGWNSQWDCGGAERGIRKRPRAEREPRVHLSAFAKELKREVTGGVQVFFPHEELG